MTRTREEPAAFGQPVEPEEQTVTHSADRPFDWVAALAVVSGAAVMVPSLAALAAILLAVAAALL
jgi:hypothetical protein